MKSILLVEDDKNLSDSLTLYLKNEGFSVESVRTLAEARLKLKNDPPLVILDWMLPDGQGIDLLKELHQQSPQIPIILLTSRTELVDKVVGLESGASDYLTKPFEPRELCARIRVQLRKTPHGPTSPSKPNEPVTSIECSGIKINFTTRETTFRGHFIELTKMEFELLKLFISHPNRVFTREALLNQVWGYENYPTTRTVDNHVVQIRQKFDADLIETIRGIGYRLRDLTLENRQL
jgi:DNA-binding response OmpR family regulator